MGKVFIHVGLQKTGSTYLQTRFFPQLAGILYIGRPYTQVNEAFNRLQFGDDVLYREDELRAEMGAIRERAGEKPILISDELFAGYAPYGFCNRGLIASRLSAICPGAEILLFLRGQEDEIVSLHNQYVKSGLFDGPLDARFLSAPGTGFPLEKWLEGHRGWDKTARYFDNRALLSVEHFRYRPYISFLRQKFARVHVFLYESLRAESRETLTALSGRLGVPEISPPESGDSPVNEGIPAKLLDRRIRENRIVKAFPALEGRPARWIARVADSVKGGFPESGRMFVRDRLRAAGIPGENRVLDEELDLGMSRFAGQYFQSTE